MRLIDADKIPNFKIIANLSCGEIEQRKTIQIALWGDIEKTPTVDAEPVVRCKNCQSRKLLDGGWIKCKKYNCYKSGNGFCDKGKPRDGEQNE